MYCKKTMESQRRKLSIHELQVCLKDYTTGDSQSEDFVAEIAELLVRARKI
jgi:hypothetical protein